MLHPGQETTECQPPHQHQEVQGADGHHARQLLAGRGRAAIWEIQEQRRREKVKRGIGFAVIDLFCAKLAPHTYYQYASSPG